MTHMQYIGSSAFKKRIRKTRLAGFKKRQKVIFCPYYREIKKKKKTGLCPLIPLTALKQANFRQKQQTIPGKTLSQTYGWTDINDFMGP